MTKEEIFIHLPETYKEELHDVIKYVDMSKNCDNDGYSQIFRDIAREEYQHACHIKEVMKEKGLTMPDNVEADALHEKAHKALEEVWENHG